jgi:hypothetical protein
VVGVMLVLLTTGVALTARTLGSRQGVQLRTGVSQSAVE